MFAPQSLYRACWVLRIALTVQCAGLGAKLLWGEYESESEIYGWLYFDRDWPEELALWVEDVGTTAYFAAGLTVLAAPALIAWFRKAHSRKTHNPLLDRLFDNTQRVQFSWLTFLQVAGLLFIALWQLANSSLHAWRGGSFMSEWTIAAHATRIFTPLALIALLISQSNSARQSAWARAGDWILRLATASMFITHGVEAIRLNAPFIDLLIGSADNLLGLSLRESATTIPLYVIGAIDIVLAVALLLTRWRWVPAYLAFWGFVTAGSRITAAGLAGFALEYPETLIRAAHGGAPLALYILWYSASSHSPSGKHEHET